MNQNGTVKALQKGKVKITALVNGKKYTCTIKVEAPTLSTDIIYTNKIGDSQQLKVSGTTQTVKYPLTMR